MSISGYIATYVNRCRGGLRHRGALVLLAVVATVAAACVGTLPDVEIDPADLEVEPEGDIELSGFQRLNPDGPKLLAPREYDQRLPLDAIRPIYEPLVGSPDEAQLDADELVMGVSINGESRAYPIKVLRFREIVNDELGGSPILVTW